MNIQKGLTWVLAVMCSSGLVACAEFSRMMGPEQPTAPAGVSVPDEIRELAGMWEYADKTGSYTIVLNEQGKGTYEWEDGWFETHYLENGVWKGKWVQAGNDREGEFELEWTENPFVAKGHWWYTRIGPDTNPLEPGGTFTMKRIKSFLTGGKSVTEAYQ